MSGVLVIDVETYSPVILADTNPDIYASHPKTGIWCAVLAFNDQPVHVWYPGAELPHFLCEAIEAPDCLIAAHNAAFEIAHWRHQLTPRYGWPELPPLERWRCTMAAAQKRALPASLALLSEVLRLEHRKGDDRLMKQMARPRLPRSGEDQTKLYWDDDPDHFRQLCKYCVGDVECERELYQRLLRYSANQNSLFGSTRYEPTNVPLARMAR
jgi:DNA polymerase